MKVTNEHYALIKQQMKDGMAHLAIDINRISIAQWIKSIEDKYAGYTETRKLWDVYWGTGGNDWKCIATIDSVDVLYVPANASRWTITTGLWREIRANCSTYSLSYNDDHLGTAIKKAYYEIKQEIGNV